MRRRHFLVLSAASVGGVIVYSLDRNVSRLSAQDKSAVAKADKSGKAAPSTTIRIPLRFFTESEAAIVAAAASRIFPADDAGPGAHEAGVVVFIDRQLAGAFGDSRDLFMRPPFARGTPRQGPQSSIVPRESYRASLAALDGYCKATFAGKAFATLDGVRQDHVLTGLENGEIRYPDGDGKAFFEMILANTIEGFFADPVYGGNRDMVGWKLIGFPGARYDQTEFVTQYGAPYPLPPVGLAGRPGWNGKG